MNKWLKFGITNFFTALRAAGIVCLIPVFKIYGGAATALLSAGCFATDFVDGFLARKLKCSTFFGSLFDGISDKAFLIVNMLLLMSITPLAIIPIALELGIAGLTITLAYLLVDPTFINYLGADIATKVAELGNMKLFGIALSPLVLNEILTLGSYIKELREGTKEQVAAVKEEKVKEEEKTNESMEEYVKNMDLKDMLFDHEFYDRYKDEGNLKLIRSLAKRKKK